VYRFMERALVWLVLGQLGLLWLSTMVVIVEPQEKALLERFGRPAAGRSVMEPGLRFKLPWPIEKAYRYNTEVVQRVHVGVVEGDVPFDAEGHRVDERVLLWTKPHYKEEYNLLVASRSTFTLTNAASAKDQAVPADLLTVSVPVHFIIKDLEQWAYQHASPSNLLEQLATREVVRHLVSVDMDDIMAVGRIKAASDLKQKIQQRADDARLGVQIVFVGLQDIHPPTSAAASYENVIGGLQTKETKILEAKGFAGARLPKAEGDAFKRVADAQARAMAKVTDAAASGARFTNQLTAFKASPRVYSERSYLETLAAAIRPARKYVLLTTNTADVFNLNLEDKARLDDVTSVVLPELKNPDDQKDDKNPKY
jgi:regulator of protease activity HflC (stomatin/prohibitin superfamily)